MLGTRTRPKASYSSTEQTIPIYSLPSRWQWEWVGDVPRLTDPSAHAAKGPLALPVAARPPFLAHENNGNRSL